jgi:lysozyme family protein
MEELMDYSVLTAANAERWAACQITDSRRSEVQIAARRLTAPGAKLRYQAVEGVTGVPWFIVAVIHEREASQRWDTQLGQGDPLHSVSVHVPRGRGPFLDHDGDAPGHDAWHRAALDALIDCPPYTARWKDWSSGGALTATVLYNGIGYEVYHHEASPYNWGATNQQQRGKYVRDGVFDPNAWDSQVGCAALLKGMIVIDSSIKFADK